jgi:hypothetical protein
MSDMTHGSDDLPEASPTPPIQPPSETTVPAASATVLPAQSDVPPPAPTVPAKPVDRTAVAIGASALALLVGSLTPWVSILGFGISGVSIHYGIVSLVAAAALLLLGYLRTRSTTSRALRVTASTAALAALLSAASAIYVGFAIRSSFSDDGNRSDDEFAAVTDAFTPDLGFGLWLVLIGALFGLLLTVPVALNRAASLRFLVITGVAVSLIGGGGAFAADQKAQADHKRDVVAAQKRAEAKEKAEAAAEAAREQAEAQAEADAEEAARQDRENYSLKPGKCQDEGYGETSLSGTLVNGGGTTHSYVITVPLLDASGAQVDSATDYVNVLPGGQTAAWKASGYGDGIQACGKPLVEVSAY